MGYSWREERRRRFTSDLNNDDDDDDDGDHHDHDHDDDDGDDDDDDDDGTPVIFQHQETVIFQHQETVIFQHQKTVIFQHNSVKSGAEFSPPPRFCATHSKKERDPGSFGTFTHISVARTNFYIRSIIPKMDV